MRRSACDYVSNKTMFHEQLMKPLTCEQWRKHNRATSCHICLKGFKDDPKVRDHCHYTGSYQGPVHSICNLRYKTPHYIPIVFYNLSGYDAHLFVRELRKKFNTCKITVIAENKDKYISFNVDVIVEKEINLVKDGQKQTGLEDYSEEQYELLIKKGVYLYEYMSGWNKFDETRLPPKKAFYSNLNMSDISDQDYSHAQKVWKGFGMKNLGEYHDLYLKTDVILPSNIFEAFRSTCLKHYDLNPAHFYASPG